MNCRQMIIRHLLEIGADGLCNPEIECGCGPDDLRPCGAVDVDGCVAAKRKGDLYFPMEGA